MSKQKEVAPELSAISKALSKVGYTRCLPGKRTIFINFNTQGNIGKTTETLGVIEVVRAAVGAEPVFISTDTVNKSLLEIYGSKNAIGVLDTKQILGKGVVTIDMTSKDGKLSDVLTDESIDGRDVFIDTLGVSFEFFATMYGENGLSDFYNALSEDRIVSIDPIDNLKNFENIVRQHEVYSELDTDTEIILVRIFSKGKIGSQENFDGLVEHYNKWKATHSFPSNIKVVELVFDTKWGSEDVGKFFRENKIREATKNSRGNTKILGGKFMNERDAAWSKVLFEQDMLEEMAERDHPTDNRPGKKWGETLFGRDWVSKNA